MEQSDQSLVRAYREDGEEAAINTLVERYVSPVFNLLVRLVGDRHEAEDLTQETFMKMWKGLPRFDLEKNFKTWLFAIARNVAIDFLRKKRPTLFSRMTSNEETRFEDTLADTELLADELFEQRETKERIEALLDKLSLDEKTIIVLHDSDELTFDEIAGVVGEPMNTVKSRYRRALTKLRQMLKEFDAPK